MYLTDIGQTLRRRWYLLIVVLAISAAGTYAIVQRLPATFRATASIVLVPPQTTLGDTGNPYLFLGGLQQSVDVLSRDLGSEQVEQTLKQEGGASASYAVTADYTTSAPIVLVTTEAPTGAAADAMLKAVVAQVPVSLDRLQAALAVPGKARITTQLISRSERPHQVMSGRYRAIVVVGGFLAVAGILLLATVDGLVERRRLSLSGTRSRKGKRRGSEPEVSEEDDVTGEGTEAAPPRVRRFTGGRADTRMSPVPAAAQLEKPRKTGTDG